MDYEQYVALALLNPGVNKNSQTNHPSVIDINCVTLGNTIKQNVTERSQSKIIKQKWSETFHSLPRFQHN